MKKFVLILSLLVLFSSCKEEYQKRKTAVGPKNGSLLIVGGHLSHPEIYQKFKDLAGGSDKEFVIIITAASDESLSNPEFITKTENRFKKHGIKNITVLHTRDPKVADSDSFINPIKSASGVWFTGGRQWRLIDAYENTKTLEEIQNVLKRSGVIGGSSAGASIQGSFLVRGDSKTNTIMMGDHQKGFGFLKNAAIDQHLLAMNRQFDIFEILEEHPQIFGIGLDENTGIVVKNNEFEVIGEHYVAIYDGTFFTEIRDKYNWNEVRYEQVPLKKGGKKYYLLKKGDRYDLNKMKVIR